MPPADRHLLEPEAQRLLNERLGRWQQRRAALCCVVVMALLPLTVVSELTAILQGRVLSVSDALGVVVVLAVAAGYGAAAWMFHRMPPSPPLVARRFGWLLMAAGAISILTVMLVLVSDESVWGEDFTPRLRTATAALTAMLFVFGVHFIGSLFVALPPRAALWPLLPLWLLFAACIYGLEGPLWFRLIWMGVFPLVGLPGVFWSVWRHERWVDRFTIETLGGSYHALSRDLAEARRVHEALFPAPIDDGPVHMEFAYEPMRHIGGDFLFARRFASGALLVVVVDVTGHGVASALAVTRIHAVLSAFAAPIGADESDVPSPQSLIARLNAFIHESLAPQGVFATAVACLVDPAADVLCWSSAGHPPVLLRHANGGVVELGSTSTMLGVLPAAEFDAVERETPLGPGDALVLCTDGVLETEGGGRAPFGLEGLRRVVRAHSEELARMAMQAVRGHRAGQATDDVLVVGLRRV